MRISNKVFFAPLEPADQVRSGVNDFNHCRLLRINCHSVNVGLLLGQRHRPALGQRLVFAVRCKHTQFDLTKFISQVECDVSKQKLYYNLS